MPCMWRPGGGEVHGSRGPADGGGLRDRGLLTVRAGHTYPQPEDLGRYYGSAYHGGRHGFTARYCARRRERFVRQSAGAPAGRRLLDVGCGDGTFLLGARTQGWDVAGTELNPAIARDAGLRVWSQLEEAAERAPYACITLWHSLEHMRAPRETIEQAARMLEPGGTLVVAVPNAGGLQASAASARHGSISTFHATCSTSASSRCPGS